LNRNSNELDRNQTAIKHGDRQMIQKQEGLTTSI